LDFATLTILLDKNFKSLFIMSDSDGKKVVTFKAADKKKKGAIPTSVAPDAVEMAGGRDGADRTQQEFQETEIRDRTATDEQFPTAALTREDPEDKVQVAKLQLQGQGGLGPGVTPFGQLIASDSDFKWLQKKRDMEAEANFQQWFASNFDKMR
jgi:hypothetical protein